MYDKLRLRDNKGELLRSHHHTYLGSEFIQDCYMWLYFLSNTDVCKLQLCRPFLDFDDTQVWTVLNFYSDVSLNCKLGFGAVFNNRWLVGQWPKNFVERCKPSIDFLELYALTVTLTVWQKEDSLQDTRVKITKQFCTWVIN